VRHPVAPRGGWLDVLQKNDLPGTSVAIAALVVNMPVALFGSGWTWLVKGDDDFGLRH
jgi:superoxide dismutase